MNLLRIGSIWGASVAGFLGIAITAGAQSTATPAPPNKVIASFVLTSGEPNGELVLAFKSALTELGNNAAGTEVLSAGDLRIRLRTAGVDGLVEALVLRCGSDLACIADIGRKGGAQEVLLARIAGLAEQTGITMQIVVIGVDPPAVLRKAKVQATTAAEITTALAGVKATVFGEEATSTPAASTPIEPKPDVAAAPSSTSATPTPQTVAVVTPVPWWRNHAVVRPTGIGVAGAGVVTFVVGTVVGAQARSTSSSIEPTTNQPEAVRRESKANDEATAATALMVTGALVAVVGGGILAWDLFGIDRVYGPTAAIAVGREQASVRVSVSW